MVMPPSRSKVGDHELKSGSVIGFASPASVSYTQTWLISLEMLFV